MNTSFDTHLVGRKKENSSDQRTAALRNKIGMNTKPADTAIFEKPSVGQGQDVYIMIDKLIANPFQPRLSMDEERILELASSIKDHGVLQPIAVLDMGNGTYMIRFGHRRVKACEKLGHKTIRAIIEVGEVDNYRLMSEALIENLQRDDMHIIDIAFSMKMALENGIFENYSALGKAIGKDRSQVSRILNILSLPDAVLKDIAKNKTVSDRVVLDSLRKIVDPVKCEEIYQWYVEKKPNRSDFEKKIKGLYIDQVDRLPYTIKNTAKGCTIKITHLSASQEQELQQFMERIFNEETEVEKIGR